MVEGMSVVLNVMLSLISVMSPYPAIVQPIGTHGGEVMCFRCVCFRGELGFLNCDDICMCVVISSLSSSSLFLIPFMLTCSMKRFLSPLLLGPVSLCCVCSHVVVFGLSVRLPWYPMWMRWLL